MFRAMVRVVTLIMIDNGSKTLRLQLPKMGSGFYISCSYIAQ